MNIFTALPTAFPWYDKIEKQNRFRDNVADTDLWGLITPSNALLPFQFWKTGSGNTPANWDIIDAETGTVAYSMDGASLAFLRTQVKEGRRYFYYAGEGLATGAGPLTMDPGVYYSRISMTGGTPVFYSELFEVPECSFISVDPAGADFIKLEWWNTTDIRPIFYNDLDGGGIPYFRNVVYLDSFIHASEPKIEREGEQDGNDELIPTFEKMIVPYRISDLVPDFLKIAFTGMQIHDNIILTDRKAIRSGPVYRVTVTSALEFNGAFSTVDLLLEEEVAAIKKGCSDNMT